MTTLRDDLQPVVDEARGIVDDLGFRPYTVTVRTTTWSGSEVGRGTATDSDDVIDPPPKVSEPGPRRTFAAPGSYQDGDRIVSRISRSYTEDEIAGALTAKQERVWLLDNGESEAEYIVVGQPEKRPLEWRVHLRRRNRARA